MSDDLPLTPAEETEALAAELALGLLHGDEAARAIARQSSDAAFAAAVRGWQERLAELAEELTPVMPPARARQRIREELGHARPPLSKPAGQDIVWWRRPWAQLGGLAVAVVLALALVMPMLRTVAPDYQAELVATDIGLRVLADLEGRQMSIMLQEGPAPEGRDWQAWWIRPDGTAPVSLGIVPRTGALVTELPQGLVMVAGVKIAVSDEPAGGSPTGQVTGAVVAAAALAPS